MVYRLDPGLRSVAGLLVSDPNESQEAALEMQADWSHHLVGSGGGRRVLWMCMLGGSYVNQRPSLGFRILMRREATGSSGLLLSEKLLDNIMTCELTLLTVIILHVYLRHKWLLDVDSAMCFVSGPEEDNISFVPLIV